MERNVSLEEITDGKKYHKNDMVRLGCNDCDGCSACCQGMGESIVLDPWDIHMLSQNLQQSFEDMIGNSIELHSEQGMILPHLKLSGKEEKCTFLNEEGRCLIHAFRPGFCRLFPLEDYMKRKALSIFYKRRSAIKKDEPRSRSQSGLVYRIWMHMRSSYPIGITLLGIFSFWLNVCPKIF